MLKKKAYGRPDSVKDFKVHFLSPQGSDLCPKGTIYLTSRIPILTKDAGRTPYNGDQANLL